MSLVLISDVSGRGSILGVQSRVHVLLEGALDGSLAFRVLEVLLLLVKVVKLELLGRFDSRFRLVGFLVVKFALKLFDFFLASLVLDSIVLYQSV